MERIAKELCGCDGNGYSLRDLSIKDETTEVMTDDVYLFLTKESKRGGSNKVHNRDNLFLIFY